MSITNITYSYSKKRKEFGRPVDFHYNGNVGGGSTDVSNFDILLELSSNDELKKRYYCCGGEVDEKASKKKNEKKKHPVDARTLFVRKKMLQGIPPYCSAFYGGWCNETGNQPIKKQEAGGSRIGTDYSFLTNVITVNNGNDKNDFFYYLDTKYREAAAHFVQKVKQEERMLVLERENIKKKGQQAETPFGNEVPTTNDDSTAVDQISRPTSSPTNPAPRVFVFQNPYPNISLLDCLYVGNGIINNVVTVSEFGTNTENKKTKSQVFFHFEGGWPASIDNSLPVFASSASIGVSDRGLGEGLKTEGGEMGAKNDADVFGDDSGEERMKYCRKKERDEGFYSTIYYLIYGKQMSGGRSGGGPQSSIGGPGGGGIGSNEGRENGVLITGTNDSGRGCTNAVINYNMNSAGEGSLNNMIFFIKQNDAIDIYEEFFLLSDRLRRRKKALVLSRFKDAPTSHFNRADYNIYQNVNYDYDFSQGTEGLENTENQFSTIIVNSSGKISNYADPQSTDGSLGGKTSTSMKITLVIKDFCHDQNRGVSCCTFSGDNKRIVIGYSGSHWSYCNNATNEQSCNGESPKRALLENKKRQQFKDVDSKTISSTSKKNGQRPFINRFRPCPHCYIYDIHDFHNYPSVILIPYQSTFSSFNYNGDNGFDSKKHDPLFLNRSQPFKEGGGGNEPYVDYSNNTITAIAFNYKDGNIIAVGSYNGVVSVFDLRNASKKRTVRRSWFVKRSLEKKNDDAFRSKSGKARESSLTSLSHLDGINTIEGEDVVGEGEVRREGEAGEEKEGGNEAETNDAYEEIFAECEYYYNKEGNCFFYCSAGVENEENGAQQASVRLEEPNNNQYITIVTPIAVSNVANSHQGRINDITFLQCKNTGKTAKRTTEEPDAGGRVEESGALPSGESSDQGTTGVNKTANVPPHSEASVTENNYNFDILTTGSDGSVITWTLKNTSQLVSGNSAMGIGSFYYLTPKVDDSFVINLESFNKLDSKKGKGGGGGGGGTWNASTSGGTNMRATGSPTNPSGSPTSPGNPGSGVASPLSPGESFNSQNKVIGGTCLYYNIQCSGPNKYLLGTNNGTIIQCNRKSKKQPSAIGGDEAYGFVDTSGIYSNFISDFVSNPNCVYRHAHDYSPVLRIQRNSFVPKFFISISLFSTKVFSDDNNKDSVLEMGCCYSEDGNTGGNNVHNQNDANTNFSLCDGSGGGVVDGGAVANTNNIFYSDCCWSPARAAVFFVGSNNLKYDSEASNCTYRNYGMIYAFDILYSQREPFDSLRVFVNNSNSIEGGQENQKNLRSLTKMAITSDGKTLAIGDTNGSLYLMQLAPKLYMSTSLFGNKGEGTEGGGISRIGIMGGGGESNQNNEKTITMSIFDNEVLRDKNLEKQLKEKKQNVHGAKGTGDLDTDGKGRGSVYMSPEDVDKKIEEVCTTFNEALKSEKRHNKFKEINEFKKRRDMLIDDVLAGVDIEGRV